MPRDLEDAATVLSVELWRWFIYKVLTLSVPTCASVGILAFTVSFNQYRYGLRVLQ